MDFPPSSQIFMAGLLCLVVLTIFGVGLFVWWTRGRGRNKQ